LSNPNY